MPKRVQMTRQRPWRRDHPDAVIVARPSKFGNPFRIGEDGVTDAADAVQRFRALVEQDIAETPPERVAEFLAPLRGRDLACWCPLDQPCHADVLLELANEDVIEALKGPTDE